MRRFALFAGPVLLLGTMLGTYLVIDHKVNPPPIPIVVEQHINILEEVRKLRINPYSERLQADYHDPSRCENQPTHKYFARACLTLEGLGEVIARYDFSTVEKSDIRHDGNTVVVRLDAPTITVVLSDRNVRTINPDFGFWNSDEDVLDFRRRSRIALENTLNNVACERGIIRKAAAELNKGLPDFINTVSAGKIRVRFETTESQCALIPLGV